MALSAQERQRIHNEVFGRNDYPPIVTFYDHAIADKEATKEAGRPIYKEVVYCLIKPTHPDLRVRDSASRKATDRDKLQYPDEWAKYEAEKKRELEFAVPLQAVPGMGIRIFKELTDLGINTAEDLAAYDGDLDEIEYMRDLAKKIIGVSNEARSLYEGRGEMGEDSGGQVECDPPQVGASDTGSYRVQPAFAQKTPEAFRFQEEGLEEKDTGQESAQTFHYEVSI